MAKKKKHHEEEHENMERWLVSYADFITLLFAFFVTMYSVSRVDGKKLGSAVESLQRALGSVMPIQMTQKEPGVFPNQVVPIHFSLTPIEGKPYTADGRALVKMAEDVKKGIEELSKNPSSKITTSLAHQIRFILEKRGLVIRISEHIFFNSGEATIRPEMEPILQVLGRTLEKVPNHVRIEGHTDNVPIHTPRFPSNWELSTARATTIVRYLLEHFQFDPERLSATGYGEYRPIATNQTPEGRMQNRRVDFVILSQKEMETEPQKEPGSEQKNPI
ncbi:MAG: OmpA family protein [Desulfobacterota bacterium]|nr:OmpA family protein [Thermodesulfobacteriota bacterium]